MKSLFAQCCLLLLGAVALHAQHHAIKVNLLDAATVSLNAGWERTLTSRLSFNLSGSYNPWTFPGGRRWRHLSLAPSLRLWSCEPMNGHFGAVTLHGGVYNYGNLRTSLHGLGTDLRKLRHTRYEGEFVGIGFSYGYAWMLSRHFNLEAELGVGYSYCTYQQYRSCRCSDRMGTGSHHYFGPTKVALSLVYVF